MTINYTPVSPGDTITTDIFNKIRDDLQNGISSKVSISNPIFSNSIAISNKNIGNVYNVAPGLLPNDAVNYSQYLTGVNGLGVAIGDIILFDTSNNNPIPMGYALCDGNVPISCPKRLNTPLLEPLSPRVKYIIRIK